MTNEEYCFKQTIKKRKSLARGSFYKKCGSKSKKCSLPSDKMTAKQRKELNGQVMSYNLNKPMTWKEFKELPTDIQKIYLLGLEGKGASNRDISVMFEIGEETLRLKRKELNMIKNRNRWNAEKPIEWLNFLGIRPEDEMSVFLGKPPEFDGNGDMIAPTNEEVEAFIESKKAKKLYVADRGTLHYTGDPNVIFGKALNAIDMTQEYKITIIFESIVEE